jgi:hypothetical protein
MILSLAVIMSQTLRPDFSATGRARRVHGAPAERRFITDEAIGARHVPTMAHPAQAGCRRRREVTPTDVSGDGSTQHCLIWSRLPSQQRRALCMLRSERGAERAARAEVRK